MVIGSIETIDESEPEEIRRGGSRVNSPGGKSGGSGGGDNSGGGNGENDGGGLSRDETEEPHSHSSNDKTKIMMYALLVAVVMTFGGLISAYVVIATNAALEWRPFDLPGQVWVSTAIILLSSVSYHLAKNSLISEKYELAKKWFVITSVLGGMFISSQILAWIALVGRGMYMYGNPYAGFFYILTAVHVIHVIGGICALGFILLKTWPGKVSPPEQNKRVADATAIGWYWHTMDGLWLILLVLLGFWK